MNTQDGEDDGEVRKHQSEWMKFAEVGPKYIDTEEYHADIDLENLLARLNIIERQMENFICLMDANKVQLNLIESLVQRLLNRRRV